VRRAPTPRRAAYPEASLGTISVLVERARSGDSEAREQLAQRCVEALRRFAAGRVLRGVRGRLDTDDLVQNAVMRAFQHLNTFQRQGHGSFLANLRTIVLNLIRDEARRLSARSPHLELGKELPEANPSPLEAAIGREFVGAYERALAQLPASYREAIVLRLEMGYDYGEIAEALEKASPNAARMIVVRALVRLSRELEAHAQTPAS